MEFDNGVDVPAAAVGRWKTIFVLFFFTVTGTNIESHEHDRSDQNI